MTRRVSQRSGPHHGRSFKLLWRGTSDNLLQSQGFVVAGGPPCLGGRFCFVARTGRYGAKRGRGMLWYVAAGFGWKEWRGILDWFGGDLLLFILFASFFSCEWRYYIQWPSGDLLPLLLPQPSLFLFFFFAMSSYAAGRGEQEIHVLAVDDSSVDRALIAKILRSSKYRGMAYALLLCFRTKKMVTEEVLFFLQWPR